MPVPMAVHAESATPRHDSAVAVAKTADFVLELAALLLFGLKRHVLVMVVT